MALHWTKGETRWFSTQTALRLVSALGITNSLFLILRNSFSVNSATVLKICHSQHHVYVLKLPNHPNHFPVLRHVSFHFRAPKQVSKSVEKKKNRSTESIVFYGKPAQQQKNKHKKLKTNPALETEVSCIHTQTNRQ